MKLISYAALAAALPIQPAFSQQAPDNGQTALVASDAGTAAGTGSAAEPPTPGDASKAHPDTDQAIVVTGVRRAAGDVLGGVSVLDEEALTHDLKPSIGDTLAGLPGVSASSFGPTASRPILRGLQGERVRILVDGIGSLDLSSSDPDHAVSINPLTAQRIEVLRGPSALLFGSSAIGGVVNVIDTRIPRSVPDKPISVDALASYSTAANDRSASASVNVPLGGHFVAHADGAYSKYDDLDIGGFVLSKPLREQAEASTDPEIQALADLKGTLPNTAGRISDIAGGVAYVDGGLNVGVSVARHSFNYGVPIRYSLDPAVQPEVPTIDGHQDRADARINVPIGSGLFKAIEWRGGIASYKHSEIEENGEVGSRFFSDGGEMRGALVQNDRDGWGGTSGIQYLSQGVRIRGDEKYLPDSDDKQFGLFTLQSLVSGRIRFEGGFRVEFARLHANKDEGIAETGEDLREEDMEDVPEIGEFPIARKFTPVSASLGANYDLSGGWRAGLSLSHSERAPAVDELFSLGPHGGSQQFLIGNPDLDLERSNAVELSIHQTSGPVHVQGSVYHSHFSNFIYSAPTGEIEDRLPVYEYREGKANYLGFELQADARFGKVLGIDWGGELVTDYVRATIKGFGPAPLIPPFRIQGAVTGSRGQVDGRLEVERVSAQNRIGPNETTTPGYTMVNASLDWHPFAANPELTLSLIGNNLFDVEARRATSVLKDYAPLAGRDIRISARLSF